MFLKKWFLDTAHVLVMCLAISNLKHAHINVLPVAKGLINISQRDWWYSARYKHAPASVGVHLKISNIGHILGCPD